MASSLIYLPSSAKDFKNPAIEPYLARYVRGSYGIDYKERIKIMKLLWDAIGTEFGGRHELYEINYAGNHEDIRIQALLNARGSGALRPDDRAGRAMHGRLRRERLDRQHLAQSRRCRQLRLAGSALARGAGGLAPTGGIHYIRVMSWIDQHPDMAGAFAAVADSQERRAARRSARR